MNALSGIPVSALLPASGLEQAGNAGLRIPPNELAKEFEGVFLSMLLKQMRQVSGPEGGLFPGDSSDTYGGLFDMYMGRHLAEQGGLGLSGAIEAALVQQGVPATPGS